MRGRDQSVAEQERGLDKTLSAWQQSMIAIGGSIGVGLFLGSGATIGLAGPAVVLTYVLGAGVAFAMGLVLAELASVYPAAGSFGVYAERFVGPWAGFVARLTYWFAQALAIGAQVTAVGVYFGYWFPATPSWVFIVGASALVVAVNAARVGSFGTLEASFSLVKVAAIVAFVALGAALVGGLVGEGATGTHHLTAHGGFAPNGLAGVWLALTLVITSYLGVEVVAVTSGEAREPERTVPRALVGTVVGLAGLYILAMLVIVLVRPWPSLAETSGELTASPFVTVLGAVGLPYAAGVMNAVVISAALTSVVTNLYLCTRMLFSLARAGYVPRGLGAVDDRGVPLRALAVSTAGMALATWLAVAGRAAFLPLFGTAVAALLSIWILVFVCHLRFRRGVAPEILARLPVRVPGHPVPSFLGIGVLVGVLASTPWVAGLETSVPWFGLWLVLASVLYRWRRGRLGT